MEKAALMIEELENADPKSVSFTKYLSIVGKQHNTAGILSRNLIELSNKSGSTLQNIRFVEVSGAVWPNSSLAPLLYSSLRLCSPLKELAESYLAFAGAPMSRLLIDASSAGTDDEASGATAGSVFTDGTYKNPKKIAEELLTKMKLMGYPTIVCHESRQDHIDISRNGLKVKKSAMSPEPNAVVSFHAAHSLLDTTLFPNYFEIECLAASGMDIGIGVVAGPEYLEPADMPGWKNSTWGHHGDDGKLYGIGYEGNGATRWAIGECT